LSPRMDQDFGAARAFIFGTRWREEGKWKIPSCC
jgi:hypothetical protein